MCNDDEYPLPIEPWAAGGGKAALPKWLFLPKGRSCWDIAKNVMYCHGCGALSEFQHIFMFLMPCALRRAFLFPKFGDNRYHLIYSFITVFII